MDARIISLRMERQCLINKADQNEYIKLYRDTQPGQNVYRIGFGEPPSLSFRADFNDIEFNRNRQLDRKLIKGRFAGGNLGWIEIGDLDLFIALYRKPLTKPTEIQLRILDIIEREGPFNIQQIKEETGLLVKEITPILHRIQEAFLIYEDQYDGEWDRSWYRFAEMFPKADPDRYTKTEALKIVLQRFAYRLVWFDIAMARSFYKIAKKEVKSAVNELVAEGTLVTSDSGYMLSTDAELLEGYSPEALNFVYAVHRNDFLYKTNEHILKEFAKKLTDGLPCDHEPLQYRLIDGEFHGASVGHFRNGPYDLNDIVCDLPDAEKRRDEIVKAVCDVNYGNKPQRFMGKDYK